MLPHYTRLFLEHPLLEMELIPLIDTTAGGFQELSNDEGFMNLIFLIVEIRPQAFTKALSASEPSEACMRQTELFLTEREETKDIFPWIVHYLNGLAAQSNRFAAAFHRPAMIKKAESFLYRCALRIMEDCRAEIGRRARSKNAFEGHKLK